MAPLSVIVTCKGRLEHLSRTLPALVANLAGAQIVLVDYDCPQGAAAWAAAHTAGVTVVRVTDRPVFNLAKARNLGAAQATAPWLLFTDADVLFTAPSLALIEAAMAPGRFLLPQPRPHILFGTVVVARADFDRVGGYDEVFEGWGAEDDDLLHRLADIGLARDTFDGRAVVGIDHDQDLRTRFHAIRSVNLNWTVNGAYLAAKRDLARLQVELAPGERQALYDGLKAALAAGRFDGRTVSHRVAFRRANAGPLDVVTSLQYDIHLPALGETPSA